ncbi:hypothetical protein PIIN_09414 [Serendipita indica DSM 11827]|uniref:Uncharacterized protein n=1 Tax=Serendipita indica (strain DSM 11827) TaxID=1109443 RepID=G4TVT8_SERID|nr:hypothetical protein PIIN_09414 [Serendipita indica DSM 11827]
MAIDMVGEYKSCLEVIPKTPGFTHEGFTVFSPTTSSDANMLDWNPQNSPIRPNFRCL